ncbi:MAG TPA: hypothetical protein VMD52_00540 [Patescibacteria group bacterium]|nr:hypothetical protein [Patescibacteria group bacterium]
MARKAKQMVWHKKTNRMISAKFLNPQGSQACASDQSVPPAADRLRSFLANYEQQIKKASVRAKAARNKIVDNPDG